MARIRVPGELVLAVVADQDQGRPVDSDRALGLPIFAPFAEAMPCSPRSDHRTRLWPLSIVENRRLTPNQATTANEKNRREYQLNCYSFCWVNSPGVALFSRRRLVKAWRFTVRCPDRRRCYRVVFLSCRTRRWPIGCVFRELSSGKSDRKASI